MIITRAQFDLLQRAYAGGGMTVIEAYDEVQSAIVLATAGLAVFESLERNGGRMFITQSGVAAMRERVDQVHVIERVQHDFDTQGGDFVAVSRVELEALLRTARRGIGEG